MVPSDTSSIRFSDLQPKFWSKWRQKRGVMGPTNKLRTKRLTISGNGVSIRLWDRPQGNARFRFLHGQNARCFDFDKLLRGNLSWTACTMPSGHLLRNAKVVKAQDPGSTSAYRMQQPYIGPELSPEYCSKITNVVYRRKDTDPYVKPWPGKVYYPRCTVSSLWMAQYFTKMRSPTPDARFLTVESRMDLIHTVLHRGAKSLDIKEWQTEDDKKQGWRIYRPIGA